MTRTAAPLPEAGGGVLGIGGHDADSPEAKKEAENNEAKALAYQDWKDAADDFDGGYDTWEVAYDTAVDGIGNKMAGHHQGQLLVHA